MSQFYDQASLVMVPSGYKDGKLYSQKPLSTSGELTFSRGSDIEATRVNANGYIEKAQVNLLLQSNSFDTTWSLGGGTLTSGQTGYDGSNDAWLFTYTSGAAIVSQTNTVNGVQTFSVYAKGSVSNGLRLYAFGSSNHFAYFDLNIGAVESTSGIIDANIEDKGNGWYRCSLTYSQTNTALYMYLSDNNNSNATSGSILIQDAQLNYGLVAQTYQETTTAAVVSGITDNMPRLNYDPANPTCPSLLLEGSRTNAITNSEYFSASGWNNQQSAETSNVTTSPEGVVNATKFYEDSSNNRHLIFQSLAGTSGTTYTFSVFAKAAERDYLVMRLDNDSPVIRTWFNLSNGTIGSTAGGSPTITDFGGGWYRCSVQYTSTGGTMYGVLGIAQSNGSEGYAGDGTSGIYIYGAMCELGSYVTSYVPTYGSSATRTADDMDTTFASAFATDGGATLFYEIDGAPATGNNATGAHYAIYFSSNDYITYNRTAGGIHRIRVNANSVANYFQSGVDSTDTVKICASVTASTATVYANGVLVDSVSITGSWASATNLVTTINDTIGSIPVKQLILFPTALTATQLAELTA